MNDQPTPSPVAAANPPVLVGSARRQRDVRDPDRTGRKARGLYPDVNRTHLAKRVKRHVSTITHILQGRNKCNTELGAAIARALGMTMEKFAGDLKREQLRFVQRRRQAIQRTGSGD